jgi:hypothetical protein
MAIGDGVSGEGATRHHWTPPVRRVVQLTLSKFPAATANTYVCHPWCGWGSLSVDFWGPGGRGDAISPDLSVRLRRFLMNLPGKPLIRHTILEHQLWTRWGGYSYWGRDDHSGALRHVHVTYLPD